MRRYRIPQGSVPFFREAASLYPFLGIEFNPDGTISCPSIPEHFAEGSVVKFRIIKEFPQLSIRWYIHSY